MSNKQQRRSSRRRTGLRAGDGTRRLPRVEGGVGAAWRKAHSPARVTQATARGGWTSLSLAADDGWGGQEPRWEARVHLRLPETLRIDFEKNISKDFRNIAEPWLEEAEDGGDRRFYGGDWSGVVFWTEIKRIKRWIRPMERLKRERRKK